MATEPPKALQIAASEEKTEDREWQRLQVSLRRSEKRSRARRADKVRRMREEMAMLSRVQCVLALVEDPDAVWDAFLDDELKATRDLVRRLLPITKATRHLLHERTLLMRLIQEHELMMRSIRAALQAWDQPIDDWKVSIQRWRALSRIHFRPWTLEQCEHEIEKAMEEIERFNRSNDKQTTGVSFMGWRNNRRVDSTRGTFQFEFYKSFPGFEVEDYLKVGWDAYTDAKTYRDVIIGPRARGDHDVLQDLGPNIAITRGAERYEAVQVDVHVVYLVFRVKTERGFTQGVRTICVPEVMKHIAEPKDVWPSNFIWIQWELLGGQERGYNLSLGGSMGQIDIDYANRWMIAALGCVLRSEQLATRRQLITSG